ncbi:MAG: hypothetical protein J6W77_07740 [Prevotella sp.]|nr:hypothetical protein [Prevotella sp.]
MTREEAKKITLKWLEQSRLKHNHTMDDICLRSPCVGKCTWTYAEYKEAIENDKPLCGLEETKKTPIDLTLRYVEFCKKHGMDYE